MKLKGRGEIKLHPLTFAQREECENIGDVTTKDGQVTITDGVKARNRWCFYGLNLKSMENLDRYSSAELWEIMIKVQTEACKAKDPTKGG